MPVAHAQNFKSWTNLLMYGRSMEVGGELGKKAHGSGLIAPNCGGRDFFRFLKNSPCFFKNLIFGDDFFIKNHAPLGQFLTFLKVEEQLFKGPPGV